ncbi:hypothetical protein A4244_12485 [Bacillus badius]|nr:hypothetical protein A4244_12485 [Bacillus badius]OCS89538.1 hypothetical protein A6M11_12500 [Bacillus badius]OVE49964.1 hypothetical protein B1A98_16195 [Bacillus badius]
MSTFFFLLFIVTWKPDCFPQEVWQKERLGHIARAAGSGEPNKTGLAVKSDTAKRPPEKLPKAF